MLLYKCMLLPENIGEKKKTCIIINEAICLLFLGFTVGPIHENRRLNWTARDLISSIINTILKINTSLKIKAKVKQIFRFLHRNCAESESRNSNM